MTTIETRETVLFDVPRTLVRWGAVFAGLAFLLGLSWLLFLFGSALGVTISDAADFEQGRGLEIGAIVWLLVTVLVAYFCGGLLAGRLAGSTSHSSGMLHGLTLWGAATAAMLLLGYWGLSSMIAAGQSLAAGAWRAGSSVASAAAQGAAGAAGEASDGESSPVMAELQEALKSRVSAALASASGGEIDEGEAREAVQELDSAALASVVREWVARGPEGAKEVLARETDLDERELDAIVADVGAQGSAQLEQLKAEASETVEKVSTYAAGTLWGFFALTVLALLACIGGGWVGSELVRRFLAAQLRVGHAL